MDRIGEEAEEYDGAEDEEAGGARSLREVVKAIGDLRGSIEFMSQKFDETQEQNREIKKMLKDTIKENKLIKNRVIKLENKIAEQAPALGRLDQYGMRSSLEVCEVNQVASEDCVKLVIEVGAAAGVKIENGDIEIGHRVKVSNKNKIPPIIVKFRSRDIRDKLESKRHVEFGGRKVCSIRICARTIEICCT